MARASYPSRARNPPSTSFPTTASFSRVDQPDYAFTPNVSDHESFELVESFWEITAEDMNEIYQQAQKSKYSPTRPSRSRPREKSPAFSMRFAEDEWLQETLPPPETPSSPRPTQKSSSAKSTWRDSQIRHNERIYKASAVQSKTQPRRVKPTQVQVGIDEPFGKQIMAYTDK